jgi:hypothetical protein
MRRQEYPMKEYPMKICVLGLTLAISAFLTVPAAARGGSAGWPGTVGPSYPYPSYCAQCGAWWVVTPPPPPRPVVRRHRARAN